MRVQSVQPMKLHLFLITFDDGSTGEIDKTVWQHSGGSIGDEFSDEEWTRLCDLSQRYRAKEKALYYLSLRDYGCTELIRKLTFGGIDSTLAEETVFQLRESGLINDARLAYRVAEDLQNRKLYPKRRIRINLMDKGFSREDIDNALAQLPDDEEKQALELLAKKRYNGNGDARMREKALAMLSRYGFSYTVLKRAIERFETEE